VTDGEFRAVAAAAGGQTPVTLPEV
jgi:hypothetical protein